MPTQDKILNDRLFNSPITDKERGNLLRKILPYGLDINAITGKPTFIKVSHGSILFMDIVSYCKIVGENTDVIVFLILKKIYDMVDDVIVKYTHIQKVETIGDAYMVVGNMDEPNTQNKEMYLEMIEFAFEIMCKIKDICITDRTIKLRIGIHAGSFVVSFYGKIRPRLCVIGRHINIASRIQSTAQPDTIQISKEMYQMVTAHNLLNKYLYIENKHVLLKNIGEVTAYTILRQFQTREATTERVLQVNIELPFYGKPSRENKYFPDNPPSLLFVPSAVLPGLVEVRVEVRGFSIIYYNSPTLPLALPVEYKSSPVIPQTPLASRRSTSSAFFTIYYASAIACPSSFLRKYYNNINFPIKEGGKGGT